MQTRSYPRTLNEAFRNTAEYGCAIERPAPNPFPRILWAGIAVLAALVLRAVLE